MSFVTIEVDLDHGRVIPRGAETLPEKCAALLTLVMEPGNVPVSAVSVENFIATWAGVFAAPTLEEVEGDPRLSYLTAKHLR